MLTFSVTGEKAVNNAIKKLGHKVAKTPCRKAARAGAKVFQTEIKKRAPVKSGILKKEVKVRSGKSKKDYVSVNAVSGFKGQTDGFYGASIEFGRGPGGWHTDDLAEQPFIRPAFDAVKKRAEEVTIQTLVKETNALIY